jgi:ubiquinone/menaquinone biosynthesis C-methylase UbiE
MARLFASRYFDGEVWGVDIREGYLEDARQRAAGLPNVCFQVGDV